MSDPVNVEQSFGIEVGNRLKQERVSSGLNQIECAKVGGVSVVTQRFYESGERNPNTEYLHNLYKKGFDVNFIVTGVRNVDGALNLALVEDIFTAMVTWERERDDPVSPELRTKVFDLLYKNFSDRKESDSERVKEYLNLVK